MGLIDFVKDAGESLLERAGVGAASAAQPETSGAKSAPAEQDLPAVLTRTVELLEIPVENLLIDAKGNLEKCQGIDSQISMQILIVSYILGFHLSTLTNQLPDFSFNIFSGHIQFICPPIVGWIIRIQTSFEGSNKKCRSERNQTSARS